MIVAVRGELFSLKIGFVLADQSKILFRTRQYGSEILLILAAEILGGENDLMFGTTRAWTLYPWTTPCEVDIFTDSLS